MDINLLSPKYIFCFLQWFFLIICNLFLLCSSVAVWNMLLCLYWLSKCMIFKPAAIADTFVALVFSNMRFYHPLSITDCDINANVEDRGYFENFAGTEKDLNHILSTFDDADHKIVNFCNSRYITFSDTASIFQISHNEFITLSLNVQRYIPLWANCRHWVCILELYAFRKPG